MSQSDGGAGRFSGGKGDGGFGVADVWEKCDQLAQLYRIIFGNGHSNPRSESNALLISLSDNVENLFGYMLTDSSIVAHGRLGLLMTITDKLWYCV